MRTAFRNQKCTKENTYYDVSFQERIADIGEVCYCIAGSISSENFSLHVLPPLHKH